ncbi:hypothetical protein [Pseudomonas sp. PB106]|uniref:hypothetical protein n=1 Tax=Pseudomonas sp. PB106 TaxID=2494699 RepID=UPI00131E87FD|nr:hypothetical protein [Pseudomonas sp. PB106]
MASSKLVSTCCGVGGVTGVSAGAAAGVAVGVDAGGFVAVVVIGNIPLLLDQAFTLAIYEAH